MRAPAELANGRLARDPASLERAAGGGPGIAAMAAAGRALRAALPAGLWGRLAPLPGAPRRTAAHFSFQPDPAPSEYGESAAGRGPPRRPASTSLCRRVRPVAPRLLGGGRQQPRPGWEGGRQNPPGPRGALPVGPRAAGASARPRDPAVSSALPAAGSPQKSRALGGKGPVGRWRGRQAPSTVRWRNGSGCQSQSCAGWAGRGLRPARPSSAPVLDQKLLAVT